MKSLFVFFLVMLTTACEFVSEEDLSEWLDDLPSANIENDFKKVKTFLIKESEDKTKSYDSEIADSFDYPVPESMYQPGSYRGRSFYVDNVHLGEDIKLDEGMIIRSIAKGRIVYYGSASGYGELVVVIQHELATKLEFINAKGNRVESKFVLSIYGHLRKGKVRGDDDLNLKVGDFVQQGRIIGFVNDDLNNGDGAEHLHMGLRLQSLDEAQRSDPSAWFRGYDNYGRYGQYFAAASRVIAANFKKIANWHPNGSLIKNRITNKVYLLKNGRKYWIKDENTFNNLKFNWTQVIDVSQWELECYPEGGILENKKLTFFQPYYRHNLNENYPYILYWLNDYDSNKRFYFNSIFTMYSWGIRQRDDIIGNMFSHAGDYYFLNTENNGYANLRDGTLFMKASEDDIYIISENGFAFKFADWDIFFALKYRYPVLVIPDNIVHYLIAGYGSVIDKDSILRCQNHNGSLY